MEKIADYKYIIPKTGKMRTQGLIFADDDMIKDIQEDNSFKQVANVATLPGIVGRAMAMPDIHYGYGFPIGGVAAFDAEQGIISPGGIGYDINCGVRLLRTGLNTDDIDKRDVGKIAEILYNSVPSGVGSTGRIKISEGEVARVLEKGARWAVEKGYGEQRDLENTEENGCMQAAESKYVSQRALQRGKKQIGTLGAGNHFLEIQKVSKVFDREAARVFGVREGQITIMIHTGSRGLGYQICDDYLKMMRTAASKYKIDLADRQLACAPFNSDEGKRYFSAMQCGANYAWANRQCIMHWVREAVQQGIDPNIKVDLIYDVCHNVGKLETHNGRKLVIHRKGATRSFGPSRREIPRHYKNTGQPAIIPGTMGTSSYLLKGTDKALQESFGSTCHGAGRRWSRSKAKRTVRGGNVAKELEGRGIIVRAKSKKTVAEETPRAYKDVSKVVQVCHNAGLSGMVAQLLPLGVVKG